MCRDTFMPVLFVRVLEHAGTSKYQGGIHLFSANYYSTVMLGMKGMKYYGMKYYSMIICRKKENDTPVRYIWFRYFRKSNGICISTGVRVSRYKSAHLRFQ